MKFFLACFFCCVAMLMGAFGQSVSVELVFDNEQYLANEELTAKVRITNFSGQTLTFGNEEDWLTFIIDGGPGHLVSQRAKVPVLGEFGVDSAMIATRRVNLAPYFDLVRPGHYIVIANVRIPQLKAMVKSKPKAFNIIGGTVLWQQDFGVPKDGKETNSPPEIRKYVLLQVTHKKELKLYFRLSDAKGEQAYRVFPIGDLISFSNPEGQLDRFNNLHVLYQTGARSFLYSVVSPDGVLIGRETHDISTSRPALRPGKDGRITVAGGARRYAATDLPPPFDTTSSADAALRQP